MGVFDSIPANAPRRKRISPLIQSIGIELECEMSNEAYDQLEDYAHHPRIEIHDDGSLETQNQDCTAEVTFWSTDMKEIEKFLKIMYRTLGVTTNYSCGLHVHVKAAHGRTALMATPTYWHGFYKAFRTYAESAGAQASKYKARLHNEWCEMRPYSQKDVVDTLDGIDWDDRYVAINLNSLHKHGFGTVEHRILPAQDTSAEAIKTLRWFTATSTKLMKEAMQQSEDLQLIKELNNEGVFVVSG